MNAQCGKRLSRSLRESDIGQGRLMRSLEDVADGIRNIVECKIVHREIPEFVRVGRMVNRLFRVLVAAIISKLYDRQIGRRIWHQED